MVIRQVEKRTNQPQEKHVRNGTVKAVIDLFGILINQDFFISLVDVNKENDISAGVSYPTPRALFAILARPESPSPFLSKACHAG